MKTKLSLAILLLAVVSTAFSQDSLNLPRVPLAPESLTIVLSPADSHLILRWKPVLFDTLGFPALLDPYKIERMETPFSTPVEVGTTTDTFLSIPDTSAQAFYQVKSVAAHNSAPYLTQAVPELIIGNWGTPPDFPTFDLDSIVADSQSTGLVYTIIPISGTNTWTVDENHVLRNANSPTGTSFGRFILQSADSQGFNRRDTLEYYSTNPNSTSLIARITDVETGERINDGIITLIGTQYAVTPTNPYAIRSAPVGIGCEGKGYRTDGDGPTSYERTLNVTITQDTLVHIPVVTYPTFMSPDSFKNFAIEAQEDYISPTERVLKSTDFATASDDTVWIGKENPIEPGNILSDSEQTTIETIILTHIYPLIPVEKRPVIYKANINDVNPWQYGFGPTRDGLTLIYKHDNLNSNIAIYDDDNDGTVNRSFIGITPSLNQTHVIQEVLSRFVSPTGSVVHSIPGNQSVLNDYTSVDIPQPPDTKLTRISVNLEPGQPAESIYRIVP